MAPQSRSLRRRSRHRPKRTPLSRPSRVRPAPLRLESCSPSIVFGTDPTTIAHLYIPRSLTLSLSLWEATALHTKKIPSTPRTWSLRVSDQSPAYLQVLHLASYVYLPPACIQSALPSRGPRLDIPRACQSASLRFVADGPACPLQSPYWLLMPLRP